MLADQKSFSMFTENPILKDYKGIFIIMKLGIEYLYRFTIWNYDILTNFFSLHMAYLVGDCSTKVREGMNGSRWIHNSIIILTQIPWMKVY